MKKKYLIILLASLFVIIAAAITFYVVTVNKTKMILNGKKNINVEIFTTYDDKGVMLKRGKKIIDPSKYKFSVSGKVDTHELGKYDLTYNAKYKFKKMTLKRTINVVDTTKPVLTLSTDEIDKEYCSNKTKKEITYTSFDNYDGDITKNVQKEEKEDVIVYSSTDSSGNTEVKEVKINYDKKPSNKFTLNGSNPTYVYLGKEYNEQGASYVDGCGKKLDGEITISGEVNTNEEGDYTISYTLNGGETLTRVIKVKKFEPKVIYLTFDDGPGANTQKVLDTLNKYNVKATFFVTNQFPSYQHLIGAEYNSGHAIAVHTYSHRYSSIYTSVDDYINDFNMMNEIIKNYTGSYSNMFRFPGGSGNTVSRQYASGVVTDIANEMTNRGYIYFDWNLSSGDAESKASTSKIISRVTGSVEKCSHHCVILFHDYKKITADALDPILAELTQRGYVFKTLSSDTPVVHAKILN